MKALMWLVIQLANNSINKKIMMKDCQQKTKSEAPKLKPCGTSRVLQVCQGEVVCSDQDGGATAVLVSPGRSVPATSQHGALSLPGGGHRGTLPLARESRQERLPLQPPGPHL